MIDYELLYGEIFYCQECDFEFNKLGQSKYQFEGSCPSCGEMSIDYLPVNHIKSHIDRLKEELELI